MNTKVIPFEDLSTLHERHPDKVIVHCHGVFDLFHYGHLKHLESAKTFGDILVVTVTQDRYVNKGPGRPRFSEAKRLAMVAALDIVDYASINIGPKAVDTINALKPHRYVKGPDYIKKDDDRTGGIYVEEEAVERHGGKLVFTDDDTESATKLINSFLHEWSPIQRQTLDRLRLNLRLDAVIELVDSFEDLTVTVIGEPIVDTYVFCKPEHLSSKSPSISARFLYEENYAGGSWAVARHLAALGCKVNVIAPMGNESFAHNCVASFEAIENLNIVPFISSELPTPRKTRFISPTQHQRMFEITNLDATRWASEQLDGYLDAVREFGDASDVVCALDFGHGLWEQGRKDCLANVNSFRALNVQTNSGNFGYNLFHKHSYYDYLVIDERELRLGMHDRFSDVRELARKSQQEAVNRPMCVTLGVEGSMYLGAEHGEAESPTYFSEPVDTTGAGDAFFAVTALLANRGADPLLIPFLGNLFAGLKTKIIGNKTSVSRLDFIRAISGLLNT